MRTSNTAYPTTEPSTARDRPDYAEALRVARDEGMVGDLYRVEDVWGGYWHCITPDGVYNFRVAPPGYATSGPLLDDVRMHREHMERLARIMDDRSECPSTDQSIPDGIGGL